MILAASDNFQDSKTTVVIHINDKNDMLPVFNTPMYATEIEEELVGAYPHHLLQVRLEGSPTDTLDRGNIRVLVVGANTN